MAYFYNVSLHKCHNYAIYDANISNLPSYVVKFVEYVCVEYVYMYWQTVTFLSYYFTTEPHGR